MYRRLATEKIFFGFWLLIIVLFRGLFAIALAEELAEVSELLAKVSGSCGSVSGSARKSKKSVE